MKKLFSLTILLVVLSVFTLALFACTTEPGDEGNDGEIVLSYETVYAYAKEAGYTGTLEELIEMFEGDSAYESAVKNGYTGTEADWLATLIGASGKDGVDGKDGIDGKDGKDGSNGNDAITPSIGENGNWWIGSIDTGVKAGYVEEEVTVTFHANGGIIDNAGNTYVVDGDKYSITINKGDSIATLPIPQKNGYVFEGWKTGNGVTDSYWFNGLTISQTLDLYAVLTKNHECIDTILDHNCDVCAKPLSECTDENNDHNCDICGDSLTECEDLDLNHACDICGELFTTCQDLDKDHNCDICGDTLTECGDLDSDHKCDVCGDNLTECENLDGDHDCDVCGKPLSECTDEDNDKLCDICGESFGDGEGEIELGRLEENDDFYFRLRSDDTYTVVALKNQSIYHVELPSEFNGKRVKSVEPLAFALSNNMISLVVPDSFTEFNVSSLYFCPNFSSLTLGKNVVDIKVDGFDALDMIVNVHPAEVTMYFVPKFIEICNLSSIDLSETALSLIAERGDYYTTTDYTSKLKTDENGYVTYTNGEEVQLFSYIGNDCKLEIPEGVTHVNGALCLSPFYSTIFEVEDTRPIVSITLPSSVIEVVNLNTEVIPNLLEVYNYSSVELSISDVVILTNKSDSKINIENGCVTYSDGEDVAFVTYVNDETDIVLPNNVTAIRPNAFKRYSNRDNVFIMMLLSRFQSQEIIINKQPYLTSITIPKSITKMADDAFEGLDDLTTINYLGSIEDWCNIEFSTLTSNPINHTHNFYINGETLVDLIIPTSVTEIKDYTFAGFASLTSVTIHDYVTSIGDRAFYNCSNLTSVKIGKSVTSIGYYAFENCSSLTGVEIPDSVISIGGSAFARCSSLTSVEISDFVTSIGGSAFAYCYKLTSITIGHSVSEIGNDAFYYCTSLKIIEVDEDNEYFCDIDGNLYSKDGTILIQYAIGKEDTSFVIPDSVTSIGSGAFSNCSSLSRVNYLGTIEQWCGITFSNEYANPLYWAEKLYLNGELVEDLVIPNTVTEIKDNAFYGCTSIKSVTIPNSVTSIGDHAFESCYKLVEIYNLSSLTIEKGSYENGYVGYYAWDVYTSLDTPSKLSTDSNGYIIYTNGEEKILVGYTGSETELTLPSGITSINQGAFYDCVITSVTIPDSVTSIGYEAFQNCISLSSVTIGNSVTSIGNSAFYNCYRLVEVYNLSSLTITKGSDSNGYVGRYALDVYTSLDTPSKLSTDSNGYIIYTNGEEKILVGYVGSETELTLPSGITSIYEYALWCNNTITSVVIPDSVISIGFLAFNGCKSLSSVNYLGTIEQWCDITFGSVGANPLYNGAKLYLNGELVEDIVIPNTVTEIKDYAFYGCTSLTSVTIGNSVTSIGNDAFYRCSSLCSVTIPDSVTSIGNRAFDYCNEALYTTENSLKYVKANGNPYYLLIETTNANLSTYNINAQTKHIVCGAFSGCQRLSSITIPDSVASIGDWVFHDCDSLSSVYYGGTEEEWSGISIGSWNSNLTGATRYYYSETEPVEEGNFWHYVGGEIVIWQ